MLRFSILRYIIYFLLPPWLLYILYFLMLLCARCCSFFRVAVIPYPLHEAWCTSNPDLTLNLVLVETAVRATMYGNKYAKADFYSQHRLALLEEDHHGKCQRPQSMLAFVTVTTTNKWFYNRSDILLHFKLLKKTYNICTKDF